MFPVLETDMATCRSFLRQTCQGKRAQQKCSGLLLGLVARSLLMDL